MITAKDHSDRIDFDKKQKRLDSFEPGCIEDHCSPAGDCTRCGNCCSQPGQGLTAKDREAIHAYIRQHNIKPCDHRNILPTDMPQNDDTAYFDLLCPFLDTTNGIGPGNTSCTIYDVRPLICRHYLCRSHTDQSLCEKTERALLQDMAAQGYDLPSFANQMSVPTNMQQEFFPELRIQKGDLVMVNPLLPDLHDQFLNIQLGVLSVSNDYAQCIAQDGRGICQIPVFALTKSTHL